MPRLTRRDFLLGGMALLCCSCSTVPITGRSQLMLVSQAEETALGAQAYREVLQKEPVTRDPRYTEPVQRLARRLEGAVNRPDLRWEVSVIQENTDRQRICSAGRKNRRLHWHLPCGTDGSWIGHHHGT